MATKSDALKTAIGHHRAGELDRAQTLYRDVLRVDPGHADALHLLGLIAYQRQEYETAAETIGRAIIVRPEASLFHCNLGAAYRAMGRSPEALAAFREAVRLDPRLGEAQYNLALELRGAKQYAAAAVAGLESVELNPQNAKAHHNLGVIYNGLGNHGAALDCFLRAIEIDPHHVEARVNAGTTLLALRRPDEAIGHLEHALSIDPQRAGVRNWLGRALHDAGRLHEAAAALQQAIADDPDDVTTWLTLGNAFISSRQLNEARACFRRIVDIDSNELAGWTNLANVLKTQHKCDEAAAAYRQVERLAPDQPLGELWRATLCPLVFQSNEEIDAYRRRLAADLQRIAARELRLDLAHFDARASVPPSHLQFHGQNNRPLLEQFAAVFGHCFRDDPPPRRTGKPKLGIVVTSGHEGVFARCQGRILEQLTTDAFDLFLVCSSTGAAALRAEIDNPSIGYAITSHRIEQSVETIRAARFDVLYFWETGSDVMNYFLPYCRLAPVQCVGPGNSQTSGIPMMDYFLSSESQEPADADEHYTETLIRLRTLESFQTRVGLRPNAKQRADFGFDNRQTLYVCSQKIQKVHPDYDHVLAGILRRDGRGVVVLVEDGPGVAAEMLRRRFAATIGDVAGRIRFVPRLKFDDYLALTAAADVLLDPIHYGGGITLYDWVSLGKPLVTWPSRLVRGRYALGFYRKMGVTSCVAQTLEEYVDIAVAQGTDALYRSGVETQIRAGSDLIFEDRSIVDEHLRVFEMLVEKSRG